MKPYIKNRLWIIAFAVILIFIYKTDFSVQINRVYTVLSPVIISFLISWFLVPIKNTIENFLKRHTEFELIKQEKLYPHRVKGEGHFVAKLKKIDGGVGTVRKHWRKADKRLINLYRDFEKQYLNV